MVALFGTRSFREFSSREAANGNTGNDGWGIFVKHEHELTADGRGVAVLKYGRSFDQSGIYKHTASGAFVFYDPPGPTRLRNDLIGFAFVYAQATGLGPEYNAELFYRFPVFPMVDMTLSYQSVIRPALDPDNSYAGAFSIRLRTTF